MHAAKCLVIFCVEYCRLIPANLVFRWEDVGEDAATFRTSNGCNGGSFLVTGGGAKNASDKVFQFNGGGTLTVNNFQV